MYIIPPGTYDSPRLPEPEQVNEASNWGVLPLYGYSLQGLSSRRIVALCMQLRVNGFLGLYVPDAIAFRNIMRATGTVLSSEAALSFLLQQNDPSLRLQFFCPHHGFDEFIQFIIVELRGRIEYHGTLYPLPPDPADGDITPPLPDALPPAVEQQVIIRTDLAVFDVVQSTTCTPLTPIAHFGLTALIHFISADAVCMAYPFDIEDRRAVVAPEISNPHLLERYAGLGFTLYDSAVDRWSAQDICAPHGYCPRSTRHFADSNAITLHLNALPMPAANPLHGLSHAVGWVFGGEACRSAYCNCVVSRQVDTVIVLEI